MARADTYCEHCKEPLPFPSSREVLNKKRICTGCGKTLDVNKSILYVVETLEEQIEWLDERLKEIEDTAGIVARPKPQPVPPSAPVVAKPSAPIDLFADIPAALPDIF